MGGSVKATAPDPRLVEAQIESLGTQKELGERSFKLAEEFQPLQKEQMQFGLDANKAAYGQTQADREYALGKRGQYDKAVGAILSESDKFDEATRRQELMQQAKADISTQFSSAQDQLGRGLAARGVAPGSGKSILMAQQGELAEAAAKSRAGLLVSEAAKKEGLQLRNSNVGMLSGAPAAAASLAPSGANFGVMGLDAVNSGVAGMQGSLGAAAGAASEYGGAAANQWSNANRLSQSASTFNANANNELIGTAASMAGRLGREGYNNYNQAGIPDAERSVFGRGPTYEKQRESRAWGLAKPTWSTQ